MMELFPSRTVALSLLGFQIHWYGILYLASFLLAMLLLPRLQKYRNLSFSREEWTTVVSYCVAGVLLGGRLGFVFFYEPAYFFANPLKIFAVWEGGMASHGGFLGVIAALWMYAIRNRLSPKLAIGDLAPVPAASYRGAFPFQELKDFGTHFRCTMQD